MSNLPEGYPQAVGVDHSWMPNMVTTERHLEELVDELRTERDFLRDALRLALESKSESSQDA